MLDIETEMVIIGAGAAGLAAASELAGSGRRVLVLEARDRIGGRIWTQQLPDLAAPIEYGAEFIHGHAPATMSILRKGGKAAVESVDMHFRLRGGVLTQRNDFFHEVQQALCASRDLDQKDLSFDAFLEQTPSLSAEARQYAKVMAEGFDAADTQHGSARAIVAEWTADMMNDDAPQSRPQGGYVALLATLAGTLRGAGIGLRLQSIVRSVRWSKGSVEVEGAFIGKPFRARARCAIITLPLGVLQQSPDSTGAVNFTPALTEKTSRPAGTCLRTRHQAHAALRPCVLGGGGGRTFSQCHILSCARDGISDLLDAAAAACTAPRRLVRWPESRAPVLRGTSGSPGTRAQHAAGDVWRRLQPRGGSRERVLPQLAAGPVRARRIQLCDGRRDAGAAASRRTTCGYALLRWRSDRHRGRSGNGDGRSESGIRARAQRSRAEGSNAWLELATAARCSAYATAVRQSTPQEWCPGA